MLFWCQVLTDKSAKKIKQELSFYAAADRGLPTQILPHPQFCSSQDGTVMSVNTPIPLTHEHSTFTFLSLKKKSFFNLFSVAVMEAQPCTLQVTLPQPSHTSPVGAQLFTNPLEMALSRIPATPACAAHPMPVPCLMCAFRTCWVPPFLGSQGILWH